MNLLKKPVISEKSLGATAWGEYTFVVDTKASKEEIAKEVEKVFGVSVEKVKTMIVKGKSRRSYRTRKISRSSPWKKAIVSLKQGEKIDLFETGGESKK